MQLGDARRDLRPVPDRLGDAFGRPPPPFRPFLSHRTRPAQQRALGGRDVTDMPTLRLANLIAPVVVLAADPGLKDIGLAYERWWEVPEAIRKVSLGAGGADLAARVLFGTGYGADLAVRGPARAVQRPPVAVALAGLALVTFITRSRWYRHVWEKKMKSSS